MVRLNINLDEARKAFIDQLIASGRYRDADAFFDDAVALAQEQLEDEQNGIPLSQEEERLILEAIDDPSPPIEWTRETMEEFKRELIEEHRKRSGN